MKTSAIIAEYNPFHKGHEYLIEKARLSGTTHVVAVMSGNYVQRGECAIFSKWDRAKEAVNHGIDLVVEIPTIWSTSSAQHFARAGVRIADSIGCVDELVFGSECGDIDKLSKISDLFCNDSLFERVNMYLSEGFSYPVAREKAVEEILGENYSAVLKNPNDILGIEYITSLKNISSSIVPIAFKRIGAEHDSVSETGDILSASLIRKKIREGALNTSLTIHDMSFLEKAILMKLRTMNEQDFLEIYDVSEGLENRIVNAAKKSTSLEELYAQVKTKRYTHSRIRRIVLHAVLGIKMSDILQEIPYIKVLAFNEKGKDILRIARENAKLPIIMKSADVQKMVSEAGNVYETEIRASDIFALSCESNLPCGTEQINSAILI